MKAIFLFVSISLASGLLFTNLYTSLVDAKSWGSNMPNSIATAREYFAVVSPGNFFRIFSPLNQVFSLLVLILFWKSSPSIRLLLGAGLLMYILADVLTFTYFYPRNDVMFKTARITDIELFKKTWSEWSSMNWLRSGVLAIGLVCTFLSLHRIYSLSR